MNMKMPFPLQLKDFLLQNLKMDDWFRQVNNRFKYYSGTADPTATEVGINEWVIYKNTTANEIRIWVNDSGTMKKSAAFT